MKRTALGLLTTSALFGLTGVVAAQQADIPGPERYALRASYSWFFPTLDSDLQKNRSGGTGTLLDAVDDLGLQDERTWQIRADIQFSRGNKIRGSYTRLKGDGDLDAGRRFTFGDTTFDRFSRLVTTFRGAYSTGEIEHDFLKGPRGILGGMVGAKYLDLDTVLVAPEKGQREVETVRVVTPSIGIVGRAYLGRVSLGGEFSGLSIGKRGSGYEGYVNAQVHVSDRLAVTGGYRTFTIKKETADQFIRFKNQGGYAGIEVSF